MSETIEAVIQPIEKDPQLNVTVQEMGMGDELNPELKHEIKPEAMLEKVKIDDIKINERLRSVDPVKVKDLADSIKEIGLLNPISLSKNNELIAGMHRLEAYKQLGRTEIEAVILDLDEDHKTLAEIDENIIRNEPHFIERGDMLKKRKAIYETLYPDTRRGVAGAIKSNIKQGKGDFDASAIISFVSDTAKKINISERTVQQEIQIADNLASDIKYQVKILNLPKLEALKLIRLGYDEQKKEIEKIKKNQQKLERTLRPFKEKFMEYIQKRPTEELSDLKYEIQKIIQEREENENMLETPDSPTPAI